MKTVEKLVSAAQCRRSAQIFIIGSMISVLVPPLLMVWIAASIFAYASVAHHPDMRVREYQRWAGYRFYGLVGTLIVVLNFSGEMKDLLGGGMNLVFTVWALSLLVVVPLGIRDLIRIHRENWQDMMVEVQVHE
jgi:ABC-type antimicrobial peptide transport system permease subunit